MVGVEGCGMPLPSEPKIAIEQVASVIRPVSITMAFVVFCVTQLCNPYSNNPADCRATGADNGLSCAPCLPRATR